MLRTLLLAAPGAGKGTQGERLADAYGVPHVAAGDLLRAHVAQGTPVGEEAKSYMARGELVPDRLVHALVRDSIAGPEPLEGFVLDGFPRTITQAQRAYEWAAAHGRTFHAVISLRVSEAELLSRLLRRGEEIARGDDRAETIRRRLQIHRAEAASLSDFYRRRSLLVEVDGTGSIDEVTHRIRHRLDGLDLR